MEDVLTASAGSLEKSKSSLSELGAPVRISPEISILGGLHVAVLIIQNSI